MLVVADPELEPYPQQLTTALFSFLYHLASYENGQLKHQLFLSCIFIDLVADWQIIIG